jgi:hypothetical protein
LERDWLLCTHFSEELRVLPTTRWISRQRTLIRVADLDKSATNKPKWSWDRILRSAYIKQAMYYDVLNFFEDFSTEELKNNFFEFMNPLQFMKLFISLDFTLYKRLYPTKWKWHTHLLPTNFKARSELTTTKRSRGCHILNGRNMDEYCEGFGGMKSKRQHSLFS